MFKLKNIIGLFVIIFISLGLFNYSIADPYVKVQTDENGNTTEEALSICPKTGMKESCLLCHTTPNFKLKESNPITEVLDIRPSDLKLITDGINPIHFYYLCDSIDSDEVFSIFKYMDEHPNLPRKLIIELHNPGGHAFDAWRIVNIIESYWDKYEIETHLNGMAFSAGFLIFEAGEKRYCASTSELMWHEVSYYEFLSKITPTNTEEKLKMMRHLQDNANNWIASRTNGKTTKEFLDEKCSNDAGWWFNGKQAVEFGFADGFLIK